MADPTLQYALGLDPNNLARLDRSKIPQPDQVIYSPAATTYIRADGTRASDGIASAAWIYDIIAGTSLARLLEILDGEEYGYVYVKTDKRDGTIALAENAFSVFYAIMYRPSVAGQEGVPVARSAKAYQSVTIQFRLISEHSEYL